MADIGWMVDSVIDLYIADFEKIDASQATNIEPVLIQVRATLIVGVNSTNRAEKSALHHAS